MLRLWSIPACLLVLALAGCLTDDSAPSTPWAVVEASKDTSDLPVTETVTFHIKNTGEYAFEADRTVDFSGTTLGPDPWLRSVPQIRPVTTTVVTEGAGIPVLHVKPDGHPETVLVKETTADSWWYSAQDGRLLRMDSGNDEYFYDQTRPLFGDFGALSGFALRGMGVDEPISLYVIGGEEYTLRIQVEDEPDTPCIEHRVNMSWNDDLQIFCIDAGAITPQWTYFEHDGDTAVMVRTSGDADFAWADGEYTPVEAATQPWEALDGPLGGALHAPPSGDGSLDWNAMAEGALLDPHIARAVADGPLAVASGTIGFSRLTSTPEGDMVYPDASLWLENPAQTYFASLDQTAAVWTPRPSVMNGFDMPFGADPDSLESLVPLGDLEAAYGPLDGYVSFRYWTMDGFDPGASAATYWNVATCQDEGLLSLSAVNAQVLLWSPGAAALCIPGPGPSMEPPTPSLPPTLDETAALLSLQGHSKPF